ncbi:MAG: DUF481 domain-containing protein [Deltaproteobacteria bacterium]|nr:DUF481 domain-containing protein [Deltaproteobacteria bacterium]MBW2420275.1 DUF481 domain-containing protein [Deltaproteobacteria bacterium]
MIFSAHPPPLLAQDGQHPGQRDDAEAGEGVEDGKWEPLEPKASKYDWIQLDSGEWLKGEIRLIQNDTVYFDSDKLDDLDFDWEDITELLTGKEHTFRFDGRRIVTGAARMRGDTIRIRSGDEIQEFERSEFVSMIRGSGRELDYWSLRVGLGLSGQAGNTEQLSLNTQLKLARETALTIGSLDYTGNVATQRNELSANNHRAVGRFNVYLTRRLYLIVPSIEAFQDEFQNIELRVTPAAGFGYNIIDRKKSRWQAGLALGYQGTKFLSVEEGDDFDSDLAVQLNTDIDIDLPKRFEWDTTYQLQLVATDIGKTNQHLSSTFSFDLWGPVDLDTTFQWDWVNEPTADAAGNVPKQNDFRISVGFSLDL